MMMMMMPRSLVSSWDLSLDDIRLITANARKLLPLVQPGTKKNLNHLNGRTVATFFCEPSTRTRCSFELGAKILGAHTVDVSPENSSLSKGETIADTVETLVTMGVDALIIRHKQDGLPQAMAEKYGSRIALLNAGDGITDHPTQGLLDILTLIQQFGSLEALQGKKMTILGDITHSRVVGSHLRLMHRLGVELTLVAPDFFMPNIIDREALQIQYGVAFTENLEAGLENADVVMPLRIQSERIDEFEQSLMARYAKGYQLNHINVGMNCKPGFVILHPGPVNYNVEITEELANDPHFSRIRQQVACGVAVRMAALHWCIEG
jgi:aspartate carbamoyltransferase catalytic subunit